MGLHEEVQEQRQKLKEMTFKEKLSYFWDYYKVHTIVLIVAVIISAIFIKDAMNSKDYAFSAVLLNSFGTSIQEEFEKDFAGYAGIDQEVYTCYIDTSSTLSYENMSQMDFAVSQRITAMAQTSGIDVFISDSAPFNNLSKGMMFVDLREELTTEEYAAFEPYFYYIDAAQFEEDEEMTYDEHGMPVVVDGIADHSDPTLMKDPMPVGIYIEDSSKLEEWDCYLSDEMTPIFGFVYSSERKDTAHTFLKYLTE